MIRKILKWLFEIKLCKHGVNPQEQHCLLCCPLCYGYVNGAIMPTSGSYNGKQKPIPAPQKK